jgi:biotin operon repressor
MEFNNNEDEFEEEINENDMYSDNGEPNEILDAMDIVAENIEDDSPPKVNYFVKAYNVFLLNPKLTPIEKMLYLALRCYAGKSMVCYPSQARLAKELGIGRDTVNANLIKLQKKNGVYILNQTTEAKRKTSNLYFLPEINEETGELIETAMMRVAKLFPNPYIYVKNKRA